MELLLPLTGLNSCCSIISEFIKFEELKKFEEFIKFEELIEYIEFVELKEFVMFDPIFS